MLTNELIQILELTYHLHKLLIYQLTNPNPWQLEIFLTSVLDQFFPFPFNNMFFKSFQPVRQGSSSSIPQFWRQREFSSQTSLHMVIEFALKKAFYERLIIKLSPLSKCVSPPFFRSKVCLTRQGIMHTYMIMYIQKKMSHLPLLCFRYVVFFISLTIDQAGNFWVKYRFLIFFVSFFTLFMLLDMLE